MCCYRAQTVDCVRKCNCDKLLKRTVVLLTTINATEACTKILCVSNFTIRKNVRNNVLKFVHKICCYYISMHALNIKK